MTVYYTYVDIRCFKFTYVSTLGPLVHCYIDVRQTMLSYTYVRTCITTYSVLVVDRLVACWSQKQLGVRTYG